MLRGIIFASLNEQINPDLSSPAWFWFLLHIAVYVGEAEGERDLRTTAHPETHSLEARRLSHSHKQSQALPTRSHPSFLQQLAHPQCMLMLWWPAYALSPQGFPFMLIVIISLSEECGGWARCQPGPPLPKSLGEDLYHWQQRLSLTKPLKGEECLQVAKLVSVKKVIIIASVYWVLTLYQGLHVCNPNITGASCCPLSIWLLKSNSSTA